MRMAERDKVAITFLILGLTQIITSIAGIVVFSIFYAKTYNDEFSKVYQAYRNMAFFTPILVRIFNHCHRSGGLKTGSEGAL